MIEGCLERSTPESMAEEFSALGGTHTRQSVITRGLSHDAYHAGEISIALGQQGLPAIDLWSAAT